MIKKIILILSITLNITLMVAMEQTSNTSNNNHINTSITETSSSYEDTNSDPVEITYSKRFDNKINVDFNDGSWAVLDYENNEFIFQPYCMGDWDYKFDNYNHFKKAVQTYIDGKEVIIKNDRVEENKTLNPDNYSVVEYELNKLPYEIKQLLIDNDVIITYENILESYEEGKYTHGVYYWNDNTILMNSSDYSIEYALIHEIGHALDDILNISENEILNRCYEEKEVYFNNNHFYLDVREYVAQSIHEYFNGTLDEESNTFEEIDNIINNI